MKAFREYLSEYKTPIEEKLIHYIRANVNIDYTNIKEVADFLREISSLDKDDRGREDFEKNVDSVENVKKSWNKIEKVVKLAKEYSSAYEEMEKKEKEIEELKNKLKKFPGFLQ